MNNASESVQKEFYYYRLYCFYKHNNKKIRAKICKYLNKYYEKKHMKEFLNAK